ncbi:MAG: hypothetical protein DLM69_09220 [Candidatus Chloroheliales bacterium]|nr:MAG: hypothetical protein DLM69_09220 [Chloroflexota bacterium]
MNERKAYPNDLTDAQPIWKWAGLFAALAVSLALYLPTLSYYWVSEDFNFIGPMTIADVADQFTFKPLPIFFYRPINFLSFFIDNQLWGQNPAGWRSTNLLLNLLTVALLWLLIYRLRGPLLAALVAVIFAVHPAHPGTVTWIVSRADVPATMFMLACLICFVAYVQNRYRRYYLLALAAMVLAILTKEVAVITPALLLLADLCFFPQPGVSVHPDRKLPRINWPTLLRAKLLLHAPFIILSAGYLLLRIWLYLAYHVGFGYGFNSPAKIYENVAFDLGVILGLPSAALIKGGLAIAVLLGFIIASVALAWWVGRLGWFGLGWLFVSLAPIANITAYDTTSRIVYPATAGFAMLLAGALNKGLTNLNPELSAAIPPLKTQNSKLKTYFTALLAVTIIAYGTWATTVHNDEWRVAGELNRSFLVQLKAIQPTLPSGSRLFFTNIPVIYKRALAFNEGLRNAVRLTYNNTSLLVYDDFAYRRSSFMNELAGQSNKPTYYFHYSDDGTLKQYPSAAALMK